MIEFTYAPPGRKRQDKLFLPAIDDYVSNKIAKDKTFYEINLLEHLYAEAPFGGAYIDVGAHIGNHTLYFAKYLAEHVTAFEPNWAVMRHLRETATHNQLRNVSGYTIALGDKPEFRALYAPDVKNLGSCSLMREGTEIEQVYVDTLDRRMPMISFGHDLPVKLIKIDVEGFELQVLQGALETLRTYRPDLVVEASTAADRDALWAFLLPLGYNLVASFTAGTPTYHFACRHV